MRTINSIALTMAIPLLAFSCSTDELVSDNSGGSITINVSTGTGSGSRATTPPSGYKLVCIMQLTSGTDSNIKQMQTDVSGGTASFTIPGTDIDNNKAENAIFWAEYQPTGGGSKVYNTSDLTNINYNKTSFNLTNETDIAACEAFAGSLSLADVKGNASVTLSRPMSWLRFKPSNPDAATGAEKLSVSLETFSSLNASNSNYTGYQSITLTNASFDPVDGNWFDFFYFCPANATKLDKAIKMDLTGAGIKDYSYTINANAIPADANYIVNVTAQVSSAATQDINVSISINDAWNETNVNSGTSTPTTPEDPTKPDEEVLPMGIGSYINATGKVVSNKADAVAVVFHIGALETNPSDPNDNIIDAIENYPTQFAGKTIKGYAVSLEGISANPLSCGNNVADFTLTTGLTNGTANTPELISKLSGTEFVTQYNSWTSARPTSGNNISGWYIPSYVQVHLWFINILNEDCTSIKEPFTKTFTFDKLCPVSESYYVTSEVVTHGIRSFKLSNGSLSTNQAIRIFNGNNGTGLCYPMMTIFE